MVESIKKNYYHGADALKFFLMPFVCFACFGLPGKAGFYISQISQFAPAAFYILCGFFAAENEESGSDRGGRIIGRTALRFLLLFVILLVMNVALLLWNVTPLGEIVEPLREIVTFLLRKRVLFNFAALCIWPFQMGQTLWFIQSLLYVRIGLWLMDKLRLTRFYKLFMALGFLAMLLTGELAGVVGFRFLGYSYIPTNWLTCALPFMLLGRYVYEKRAKLLALPAWVWITGFFLGAAAACGEFLLLAGFDRFVYSGYAVGFAVMALSACCLFLPRDEMKRSFFAVHGRSYSWRIYAMSQPVGLLALRVAGLISAEANSAVYVFGGIVVYLICLLLAFLFGYLALQLRKNKEERRWKQRRR